MRPALVRDATREESDGVVLDGVSRDLAVRWFRTMALIRAFEREASRLSLAGKIPGGIHSSEGQEAVAVGAITALAREDLVAGTHRSHHHALAKGLSPRSVMAELFGKADGCAGGRGGSMHLVDISVGYLGSNGIVGGSVGLAMGAALGFHMRRHTAVALAFFGDGGVNTGRVWESANLASLWKLPLVLVCENNLYAVETHIANSFAGESITRRAAGFGLPVEVVDGQDVAAVHRSVASARARAVAGDGPSFIEVQTYRFDGHNVGEVQKYRTKDEISGWRDRGDPIRLLDRSLNRTFDVLPAELEQVASDVDRVVADAIEFAEASPWPSPDRNGTKGGNDLDAGQ